MQGFSRYDAMIRLTRSIRYTHLRSCGHLTFVGAPLEQSLTLVGWPTLTLWVESSDADADLFAYLEDQDPDTGKARYVGRYECTYKRLPGHFVELYQTPSSRCTWHLSAPLPAWQGCTKMWSFVMQPGKLTCAVCPCVMWLPLGVESRFNRLSSGMQVCDRGLLQGQPPGREEYRGASARCSHAAR